MRPRPQAGRARRAVDSGVHDADRRDGREDPGDQVDDVVRELDAADRRLLRVVEAEYGDGRSHCGRERGGEPRGGAERGGAALQQARVAAQWVGDGVVLVQRDERDGQQRRQAARRGGGVARLHPAGLLPRRVLAEQRGREQGGRHQIRRQ